MANSKLKCTGCKERFPAEQMITTPAGKFHDKQCMIDYAYGNKDTLVKKGNTIKAKAEKEVKKKNRKDLAEFNQKDVRWQHKQTQKVFNKMRVLEELLYFQQLGIEPTCISCSKPLGGDQWCCGHFKTVGAQGRLRYDSKNTYLQHNRYCNMGLSGDIAGTKNTHGYLAGLKIRFGDDKGKEIIDYCEANTAPYKWTLQEVEAIRTKCNARIREIKPLLDRQ